jgi:uncharacterized PurR-regulated membrane protein YhhQ (DUF165 family)
MSRRILATLAAAGFVTCVVGANWAISTFGLVPIGFGQLVPAGTFAAGIAFLLRDAVQETAGRWWVVVACVAVGASLSAFMAGPTLALASGAAFAVSELADMAVYTPLRNRRRTGLAMLASNTVGAVVDSLLFLGMAGFPLAGVPAQAVVKVAVTLPFIGFLAWRRRGVEEAGAQ